MQTKFLVVLVFLMFACGLKALSTRAEEKLGGNASCSYDSDSDGKVMCVAGGRSWLCVGMPGCTKSNDDVECAPFDGTSRFNTPEMP